MRKQFENRRFLVGGVGVTFDRNIGANEAEPS